MKRVPAGILFTALTACAPTIPVLVVSPQQESPPQPRSASEVMNDYAVTPRQGAGAIIVKARGQPWSAEGCTVDVTLDDELVAGLRPGEQVAVFADPGQRIVSLNVRDEAECSPASAQVALEIVAQTTQKIEVGPDAHYDLKVEVDSWGRALPPD